MKVFILGSLDIADQGRELTEEVRFITKEGRSLTEVVASAISHYQGYQADRNTKDKFSYFVEMYNLKRRLMLFYFLKDEFLEQAGVTPHEPERCRAAGLLHSFLEESDPARYSKPQLKLLEDAVYFIENLTATHRVYKGVRTAVIAMLNRGFNDGLEAKNNN